MTKSLELEMQVKGTGKMWDLIVSVPDHCLSFYFTRLLTIRIRLLFMIKSALTLTEF